MPTSKTVTIVQLVLTHYNYPLYRGLNQRFNGNVCFVVGDRLAAGGLVSAATNDLRRVDVKNRFIGPQLVYQWPLPKAIFESAVVVLELNPRIVSNWYAAWRRHQRGLATVWWGHGLSRRRSSGIVARGLRRILATTADAVILYDEASRQELIKLGVAAEKLFVAPNSIDVETVTRLAAEEPDRRRRHILFVGRLVREKKLELLLEAFALALSDLPEDTNLIIVGDGSERPILQERADALGVHGRVQFLGNMTREERLAPVFGESIVVAHPSAIGLTAIHSLAYGVPVLFADSADHGPEVEALIPGINSETFRADDSGDLARQLVSMVARPRRMREMGLAGQGAMEAAFGVERMTDAFERALSYAVSACRHE